MNELFELKKYYSTKSTEELKQRKMSYELIMKPINYERIDEHHNHINFIKKLIEDIERTNDVIDEGLECINEILEERGEKQ